MTKLYKNQRSGEKDRGGGGKILPVMHSRVEQAFRDNSYSFDSWSLFFDKFSGYSRNDKVESILKNVIKYYNRDNSRDYLSKMLVQKYLFFDNLAKHGNMKLLFFENTSRLLVNMGHSQVLENVGFSFERISGLPCVPGSALKGVVANWALWDANGDAAFAENLQGFSTNRTELKNQLVDMFGANEGDAEQGKIDFYGIFPLTVPELEIDIITPHDMKFINPVRFLTVAAGNFWYVPIAYNRNGNNTALLESTELLIEKCLMNYGVGAKTASGYGKFDVLDSTQIEDALKGIRHIIDAEQQKQAEVEEQRLEAEREIARIKAAECAKIEAERLLEEERINRQIQLMANQEAERIRQLEEEESRRLSKIQSGLSALDGVTDIGKILADAANYVKAKDSELNDAEKQQLIELITQSFHATGKKDNKWAKSSKAKDTWRKINNLIGPESAAELRRVLS